MSNFNDIAFTSEFRYEHIALKGNIAFSVNQTFPTSVVTYTIAHNLGYAPYFTGFYTFGDGKYFGLSSGPATYNLDGNFFQVDNVYSDATNIYFVADGSNGTTTINGNFYYRIYAEPQS